MRNPPRREHGPRHRARLKSTCSRAAREWSCGSCWDWCTVAIAILGDNIDHPSHREVNALIPRLSAECGFDAGWVATDSVFDVADFDAVWLMSGSPYADDAAVYGALARVRELQLPFLGTCSGMQYAVLEYLRNVLNMSATHEETDGHAGDNFVAALACSLQGARRLVTPVPGTRFASWVAEPFVGSHYCSYAPTPDAVVLLQRAGVVVGATADDLGAEVLEFPGCDFYITTMFQPHLGASRGAPIHPVVREFLKACA
jgi:CTP synthase (UTP-ammonia lyase)